METFYRVHWADAPEFSAANAWSALWGTTRSADGSQTECRTCDGTGKDACDECGECDGTGWEDCLEGYSCCYTPEDLIQYMDKHGVLEDADKVIVFEGSQVGNGFDGEPLAVPAHIVEELTWSEFLTRNS